MTEARKIVSVLPEVPITAARPPPPADELERMLGDAGQPRANRAASLERPAGSPESADNRTVLQQHVDFFDTNQDGIIYPRDTYKGVSLRSCAAVVSVRPWASQHTPALTC